MQVTLGQACAATRTNSRPARLVAPPLYTPDYVMPPTYSIWSATTIIVVGNLNMVRGTTITNTDSFNVLESTATGQSLSNTPLGKLLFGSESEASSTDLWSAPTFSVPSSNPPVDVAESAQSTVSNLNTLLHVVMLTVCGILQMDTSSLDVEHSSLLHQSPTDASETQVSLSPPRQSNSDERTTIRNYSLIKTNKFKSIYKKIKDRLKRAFDYFLRATQINPWFELGKRIDLSTVSKKRWPRTFVKSYP